MHQLYAAGTLALPFCSSGAVWSLCVWLLTSVISTQQECYSGFHLYPLLVINIRLIEAILGKCLKPPVLRKLTETLGLAAKAPCLYSWVSKPAPAPPAPPTPPATAVHYAESGLPSSSQTRTQTPKLPLSAFPLLNQTQH